MRAPSMRMDLQERVGFEALRSMIDRHRSPPLAFRDYSHFLTMARIARDRGFHTARRRRGASIDKSQVRLFHFSVFKLCLKVTVCMIVLRQKDQSGGIFIKAVYDAWTPLPADASYVRNMRQRGVYERALVVTGRWMNHHTGRFVDQKDVFILEDDVEGNRFWNEVRRSWLRHTHLDQLTAYQLVPGLGYGGAVHADVACADKRLQSASGIIR